MKLSDITEPKFELELPDGTKKDYELWAVYEAINAAERIAAGDIAKGFDGIRTAVGLPTRAEVAAAADPKPFTLSRSQCIAVKRSIVEACDELPDVKKLSALARQS